MNAIIDTVSSVFRSLPMDSFYNVLDGRSWTSAAERYATVPGFIAGAVMFILIYNAAKDGKNGSLVKDILAVFAAIVLVNTMDGIYATVQSFVIRNILKTNFYAFQLDTHGAFNPISMLLIVLFIKECYNKETVKAISFGIACYGTTICLFSDLGMIKGSLGLLIVRLVVLAVACAVTAKINSSYIAYIVMGIAFIISQTISTYIYYAGNISIGRLLLQGQALVQIAKSFNAEYISMLVGIIILALYDAAISAETVAAGHSTP